MLPDLLPVLIRIYLLPIPNVPIEDYDWCYNCDDCPKALVVPFHLMEEKSDSLSVAWPVILTVKKLLLQFLEKFVFSGISIIDCSNFVVNSRVVLERNGI